MNYRKIYNQLVQKRLNYPLSKDNTNYVERHHIIPKCLQGSDEESNLIFLSIREHYIAHLLLYKMYPDNFSLLCAIQMMSMFSKTNIYRKHFKHNSRLFELLKKTFLKKLSDHQKQLRWICNKKLQKQTYWPKECNLPDNLINDGWEFGRLKNKTYYMSESTRKKWIENIRKTKLLWSEEKKQEIILKTNKTKQINRSKRTQEEIDAISKNKSIAGKNRWKNISKEQKKEIYRKVSKSSKETWKNKSKAEMIEFSLHQSKCNKERIWISNIVKKQTKFVKEHELQSYLMDGWIKGRIFFK